MKMIIDTCYQNDASMKQKFRRIRIGLRSMVVILTVILTLVMGSLPVLAETPLFLNTGVDYVVAEIPYFVTAGDFNGDGKSDLAVTDTYNSCISILLGNGDGTFQTAVKYSTGGGSFGVAVGDFNGDGRSDLAVANADDNNLSVLLGIGDGTFQTAVNYSVGSGPRCVAVGDFNGDGRSDLVVTNLTSANISILLGNGDGTFLAAANYSVGTFPLGVAVDDFNSDGRSDILVTNERSNNVSVLLGNGNGTFQTAVDYSAGLTPAYIAAGDFNGDGKSDFVVTNSDSNNVSVFLGKGDGTFEAAANYGIESNPNRVAVDDFNGDGRSDILVTNLKNNVYLLLGNGNGTFQTPLTCNVGITTLGLAVRDFNGDGMPDLAILNRSSGNLSVFLNNNVLTRLELTGSIPDLTVENGVYDLNSLSLTGLNQLGLTMRITGRTVTWRCSGTTGSILDGHYLVPLSTGTGGKVTAIINGVTSNALSFNVLPAVNNANLSALTVTPGLISGFSSDTVTYTVYSSGSPASLTVTAAVYDSRSALTIEGQSAISGVPQIVQLDNGANLIPIVVTAADGHTQKAYVLSVNGTVSDAELGSLSVSTGDIGFSPSATSYNQTVAANTDSLTVTATPHDPKALVFLNGSPMQAGVPKAVNLAYGANSIDVMVVAQNAATKTYTIDVTRGQPTITWSAGTLQVTDISTAGLTLTWPAAISDAGISGYRVYQGNTLLSTVAASVCSYSAAGLTKGMSYDFSVRAVDQAGNLSSPLTLSVSTGSDMGITTVALPGAKVNQPYSTTLEASGGKSPYTWSATGLPTGLTLDSATGVITGTPIVAGNSMVNVTLTDSMGMTTSKGFTISVFYPAGTGKYTVTPSTDTAYTVGTTPKGIATMTVNSGVSGFKYFTVNITTVQSHAGNETAVFVHMRNGVQLAISATKADFDQVNSAMAAFNVQHGDIIKVYIVDDLTNDAGSNPALLQ